MGIKRSQLEGWRRLINKSLDHQFQAAMRDGLGCSNFEAEAVCEKVHEVYAPLLGEGAKIKPGQIQVSVVGAEVAPNVPLSRAPQCLVTLTLNQLPEDVVTRRREGVIGLRRKRLSRMAVEAFQQGGLLTIEDLSLILNCGLRTLCRDLKALREEGIVPPLRSVVRDIGRALSHYRLIVRLWLQGKEYSEIARCSYHSVGAISNYVDKFKRSVGLLEQGFEVETTALLVGISVQLTQDFKTLYREITPARHRRRELRDLFQKKPPLRSVQ